MLIGLAIGGGIVGSLGGLTTGLAARRQLLVMAISWGISWGAPATCATIGFVLLGGPGSGNSSNAIFGLLAGTLIGLLATGVVGSGVTFWQISRSRKRT